MPRSMNAQAAGTVEQEPPHCHTCGSEGPHMNTCDECKKDMCAKCTEVCTECEASLCKGCCAYSYATRCVTCNEIVCRRTNCSSMCSECVYADALSVQCLECSELNPCCVTHAQLFAESCVHSRHLPARTETDVVPPLRPNLQGAIPVPT